MRRLCARTGPDSPDHRRRALAFGLACSPWLSSAAAARTGPSVPILVFHRFAKQALDSMTLRIANFEAQLQLLQSLSCQVIPLSAWVAWRLALARGESATLPPRAVVLTADDGHSSQFDVMAPLLRERGWPVTLFIYPSAISNASYAMTWAQLRELVADPGVSVQSHTYWHPNLLRERARMEPAAFQRFAADQFSRSRGTLEQRLGHAVTLLAWPFGLSDEGLAQQAEQAGYSAAFSLGNRSAVAGDPLYAVPRHLIVDSVDASQLAARLAAAFGDRRAP
jgi:peptidoglycan/xylan/chitin deacetylase (PgdA/CDA1 family)